MTKTQLSKKVAEFASSNSETKLDYQTLEDKLSNSGITGTDAKEAAKQILRDSYGWSYSHRG